MKRVMLCASKPVKYITFDYKLLKLIDHDMIYPDEVSNGDIRCLGPLSSQKSQRGTQYVPSSTER